MKNSNNNTISSRYKIGLNDEGPHTNKTYIMREWWYYNAIFNHPKSELKNWFTLLSISSNLHSDSIKLLLHDDKNKNYGGLYDKPKGETQAKGPGVNVNFDKCNIKGIYPKWNLHFENTGLDNKEIVADLEYKATKHPIWLLRNTGHNISTSRYGYYFIMNCDVEGKITIDNTKYDVKGTGYYDHTWSPIYKKKDKTLDSKIKKFKIDVYVWDWFFFRLENGWNIFIGKIHFGKRNLFSSLMPGTLNIVSKENDMMESYFFPITYKNFQKTSNPNLKIPKEINIKSMKINPLNKNPIKGPLFLDLNYKTENIKEFLFGDPPQWGIWDSSGKVSGRIRGFRKEIELKGLGIMEYTNNVKF